MGMGVDIQKGDGEEMKGQEKLRKCSIAGHSCYVEGYFHKFIGGEGNVPKVIIEYKGGGVSVMDGYNFKFIEKFMGEDNDKPLNKLRMKIYYLKRKIATHFKINSPYNDNLRSL